MKYALVTGGSRGIGRAISLKLASMGIPVIVNYKDNEEAAKETKRLIEAQGGKCLLMQFDVSDRESVSFKLKDWMAYNPDHYIAYLVNNAGIRRDSLMFMMPEEDWHDVVNTTLDGFYFVTRLVLPSMLRRGRGGRIVNISSLSGLKGLPGQTNYSAAKAALIGATKALAQETAVRKVTVNAVAPGFIESDMTKDLDKEELIKMVPAGRFGRPEEVADLVGFLMSDQAAYITGQVISINGGLYC